MVCTLIASTSWAQLADWISQICQDNQTDPDVAVLIECSQNSSSLDSYKLLSANTVKTATIAIFIICLVLVLIISLIHVFGGLRKRKNWKVITKIVCIIEVIDKNSVGVFR